MKKKIFLFFSTCIFPFILYSQTINISLPEQSNKAYAFVLNEGIRQDTIQRGIMSFVGNVTIKIPDEYKDYIGIGALKIEREAPLNIIINHEDFTIQKDVNNKYRFNNSQENTFLYSIIQDGKFPEKDTLLYASHFVDLIRYMQQLNTVINQRVNLMDKANARSYALDKLDMECLYTSGIWYNVVDGLTKLMPDQQSFGNDMVHILKRIKSKEVFEHLADNLVVITEQYGWDDAFEIIVPYIQQSQRIEVPQGRMFIAFALAKIRKGTLTPALKGLKPSLTDSKASQTLLVFYQPDCDNCHKQLDLLIKDFSNLDKLGIRIVSVSADRDENSFQKDVERFPWVDKLCDFNGFAGQNFLNYGIMATPTFFLLDKDAKVIQRYALMTDINILDQKVVKK